MRGSKLLHEREARLYMRERNLNMHASNVLFDQMYLKTKELQQKSV